MFKILKLLFIDVKFKSRSKKLDKLKFTSKNDGFLKKNTDNEFI